MRRAILTLVLGFGLACAALPQERAEPRSAESKSAEEAGDPWLLWKWVNFAILAVGLGYMISKAAPAYFIARQKEIQDSLTHAARDIKDAEAKAADLDRRLSGIQSE